MATMTILARTHVDILQNMIAELSLGVEEGKA
jgi:hypothetical protein